MIKIVDIKGLGLFIRDIRKEQELTQEQLSAMCGVGIRFLRELEHGKETCQIGKVIYVMKMLGVEAFAKRKGEPAS